MSRPKIHRFTAPCGEPALSRQERRAKGIYYTPRELVRWMVTRSLEILRHTTSPPLRILDPACGAGAFLQESRAQSPDSHLVGIDLDPSAIATAWQTLASTSHPYPHPCLCPHPHLLSADFLSSSFAPQRFDLILGNPPYVNIRELAKSTSSAYRQDLQRRFKAARGNFDLYVLFLEKSLSLLRPGGVCGMIIPNKWACLDYARPLREMLLAETTLSDIVDLSSIPVFAAAEVYPQIVLFQRAPPPASHAVRIREITDASQLQASHIHRLMPQALLQARTISLHRSLDVESRVPTEPLGQRACLHSGASGYTAGHLAELLEEADHDSDSSRRLAPFIVSGNIDRYTIRLGNVRYMQRQFRHPLLDLNSPSLSPLKRRLYSNPKIVIAGMSRRIEAAYDERGLALGVQVYAVTQPLDDPWYLLALLNSRLLSFLFRERFAAKKLAGGYLAMNKGQLQQLPIPVVNETSGDGHSLVKRLSRLAARGTGVIGDIVLSMNEVSDANDSRTQGIDREIDELVYQLFRLGPAEIRRVEAAFEAAQAKAA